VAVTDTDSAGDRVISYQLHPEPNHVNAPDAWAVWQTITAPDADGDPVTSTECIAHGIPLSDALEEIRAAAEDEGIVP
jgi:hypothetical protein